MKKICVLLSLLFILLIFQFPVPATPINLIWQTDRINSWEEDWLMELLSGLPINVVDDTHYEKFLDNSILVISSHNFKGAVKYFKKLHKLNYNFGVILLSNEAYKSPEDFYKYPKFIFRNYWHQQFTNQKKVTVFPLGYKSGFWKNNSPQLALSSHRDFTWSFAGQIAKKPTREEMISYMKAVPHFFIHETAAWADPNSLNASQYRDLLLNTLFVPCPKGWVNLDSFRVYEALECGCIPIVEKSPHDYFSNYFGSHPFLAVDSWDQAPALMNALLADPVLLEQRRLQCYDWWQNKKKEINKRFNDVIRSSLKI